MNGETTAFKSLQTLYAKLVKGLSADDIFISYSRSDGEPYLKGMTVALSERGFSRFNDTFGTESRSRRSASGACSLPRNEVASRVVQRGLVSFCAPVFQAQRRGLSRRSRRRRVWSRRRGRRRVV